MAIDLANWEKSSEANQKGYKRLLQSVNKQQTYQQLPAFHAEAFGQINCLDCAACCKNYSPRFKTTDIKRISKMLKMKESIFIEKYLRLDEDGDYVASTKPCPFLATDNACSIYAHRPSDCVRFPYTDEDILLKRPQLTLKNSSFCKAVFYVLEKLQQAQ
jgi:uncharacterized protein